MSEQLEIAAMCRKTPAPDEDLVRLLYWLDQMGGWATAEQLMRWMDWPITEGHRRKVRALAEASGGRIASGPGAPGYILTRLLTPKDLHLVAGLKTQSERMLHRYTQIMRVWHARQEGDQP